MSEFDLVMVQLAQEDFIKLNIDLQHLWIFTSESMLFVNITFGQKLRAVSGLCGGLSVTVHMNTGHNLYSCKDCVLCMM